MIGVPFEGEQTKLDFFRLHRDRPAHGHEAMLLAPMEGRVSEFGSFPSGRELLEGSGQHPFLQGGIHPRHRDIAEPLIFQGLDDLPVVETSVESQPGARGGYRGGQLVQDGIDELPGAYGRMNVPRPQLQPQAQATPTFAGQEGSVSRLPVASFGNIATRHAFLRSVGHQRGGVGIHDGAVLHAQSRKEGSAKFVVRGLQAAQRVGAETQQEGPQRVAVGKIAQPQQRRDQAIVGQALSVLDPTQTRHDGHHVGQKQIGRVITSGVVLGPAHRELKEVTNCKSATEGLKQTEASKASKPALFEGEIELSRTSGHASQSYLKGRFVRSPFYIDESPYSYAFNATQ